MIPWWGWLIIAWLSADCAFVLVWSSVIHPEDLPDEW